MFWRLTLIALAGIFLWGSYSTEIADTDFWWHLKTGQYIVENHSLPAPDPFSYTSNLGEPAYPGEQQVRYFNLTHEWLAQALWFGLYQLGGFPLLVLWKGALLAGMCAIAGYLAAWRSGNFYVGLAAALAGMPVVKLFAADRPALLSFFLVAVFVLVLEWFSAGKNERWIWLLIPLQWAWANAHGGFFLGWVALGCYVAGSWPLPPQKRKTLWIAAGSSLLVSVLNPNGLRIFQVLLNYRQSYLTSMLIEWKRPPLWGPPYTFDVLLYLTAAMLLLNIRRVRLADALLFIAFGAASLLAFRNVVFIAFLTPVLLAAYGWPLIAAPGARVFEIKRPPEESGGGKPGGSRHVAARVSSRVLAMAFAGLLAALLAIGFWKGELFQLRAATWRFPERAAGFLKSNAIQAKMFNSYEYGGYLIWALAPRQRTFIDGRALNEAVYRDYHKILYSSGASAAESQRQRNQLLERYGAELVVMNGFEYVSGVIYPIVLALADPQNQEWQLVFEDEQAVIFARDSASNKDLIARRRLEKSRVLHHLEESCRVYIEHDPELPNCARRLGFLFLQAGDRRRARQAFELYLSKIPYPDAEAEKALREAVQRGG